MRLVKFTSKLKKDYKRELRGRHKAALPDLLNSVIESLAADVALAPKFNDHILSGPWLDFGDCHLLPDLVLIYRKVGTDVLELVRLGSHSQLNL